MRHYEIMLGCGFIAFYLAAFGLYHLALFRVNQKLPPERRLPHALSASIWHRLSGEYERVYPGGFLYRFVGICAATALVVAGLLVALRAWDYAMHR